MRHFTKRSLTVSMASSAVLSVLSIPVNAQDAPPSLDLPEVSLPPVGTGAVAPSDPVVTLPEPAAPVTQPQISLPASPAAPTPDTTPPATPIAVEGNAARASASPLPQMSSAETSQNARPSAPARQDRVDQSDRAEDRNNGRGAEEPAFSSAPLASLDQSSEETSAPDVVSPTGESTPVATTSPIRESGPLDIPDEALAGLLGLLGLGAAGFVVARRRRSNGQDDPINDAAPVSRASPPRPQPESPSVPASALASGGLSSIRTGITFGDPRPVALQAARPEATPLNLASARQITIPGESRDDTLRRMVAAPPDHANPFTSPKARRRRARMILARQEKQGDGASPTPVRAADQPILGRNPGASTVKARDLELA